MFRIRLIHDDLHPADQQAVVQVEIILRSQFPGLSEAEVAALRQQLRDPFDKRFRALLFVAESVRGKVLGFAFLLHDPSVPFCYLEFLASDRQLTSRGIGGALYDRVREEARALDAAGLFYECAPDAPEACSTPDLARQNAARLRFYENWGARPIIGTAYERPIQPGDRDMPHLVFDDLDGGRPLDAAIARRVVRAVLERKYRGVVSREYVAAVLGSFVDDPVRLRPLQYVRRRRPPAPATGQIALVVNDQHDIHHVRDRGYVEAPVRVRVLLRELEPTGLFRPVAPSHFADSHIHAVHDVAFVRYLKAACAGVPEGQSVYPYVFPIRNASRPPEDLAIRAGYYCIDTFTPLNANAYRAARLAVDCALTAAEQVIRGARFAYALVRPPGHHAERRVFGGFCYLNNNAIVAHRLSRLGRVAILDVDYHHGNGQQDIFYERDDVLTLSIHGAPRFAYPYFSGFAEERGAGKGEGFNRNYPQPEQLSGPEYLRVLDRALRRVTEFRPSFLVVALGLDTARGDPTGTWTLRGDDFQEMGKRIGALRLPTVIVQEGGYRTRSLGTNARRFFSGLVTATA